MCSCVDVSENEIADVLSLGADFITLQNKLKCGTENGSGMQELKRLMRLHHKTAA